MASIGDGMTQELRDAIKAKHKLVEQLKEDVVHPELAPKQHNFLWKIIIIVASGLLLFLAVHQMATAERASRGTRSDALKLNKVLDPTLSLTREEGKRWTSERLLRHFGLRRASQLRFGAPVFTYDQLYEAVQDPATHIITVEVAYSIVQRKTIKGLVWVNRPIIQTSSYVTLAEDGLDFDEMLRYFINFGSNKGLHVVFRDPRVVESVMSALDVEVDYGRLKGPLILEAEVLPGPESYLPELACVMTNPAAYPGGYPPRSIKAAQVASLRDGTLVPFDPVTFVAHAFKHVPGAILSLAVASHSTCTNEEPLNAGPKAAVPETMTEEEAEAEVDRIGAQAGGGGANMQLAGVITETARLLDGSNPVLEGGALHSAGMNELNPGAAVYQGATAGRKHLHRRQLLQLDALNDATTSDDAAARELASEAVEMVLMGNEGLSPRGFGQYEVKEAAEALVMSKGYSWDSGRDLIDLLKNGSWTGEVYFPIQGCMMTETTKGYVRELLSTKLGFAVIMRGPVLFNQELRTALLSELDTSRTFMGYDFTKLPDGWPLGEREVFVDAVIDDKTAVADDPERAKFEQEYKERNPGEGRR
mmetsp:Transcript_4338/g.10535  ORF Transcript_4338/g.10535 Transcript_4338/m.10535 type:complete len:590 (-) Transcript_4338:322-2091(-)